MVLANNKMFSLTPRGVLECETILASEPDRPTNHTQERIGRGAQMELDRIKQLESFRLFLHGNEREIIDSDFFEYLGVTVRTKRSDFLGRLGAVNEAIAAIADSPDSTRGALARFHQFMIGRFAEEIAFKTKLK